jgi:hypothetical protein
MHDCGRDWGNHETNGEIIVSMGAGWCHYNSGGVLTPIAILAQDEIQVTRLAGKRAWRKFGDIAPLAKESPLAVETRQFLEQVFDAARQGDRRTLLDLHGYSLIGLDADVLHVSQEADSVAASDARRIIDLWFGNPYSHLSLVRLNAEPPAVQLFEPRWKSDGWPEVWACWGIAPMAEDNSSIDALNVYGRPYACMAMVKKRISSGSDNKVVEVWVAATYGGSSVMQEPLR